MVSRAAWGKMQYTITEGTNANAVRVMLASRYPVVLSDLTEAQEATLRGATLTATPAVIELFICACGQGNLAWVEHLLGICGASCEDGLGLTPLDAAVKGGHMDVVEFLVQNGSRVNNTSLETATAKGNAEVLEFLLNHVNSDNFGLLMQRLMLNTVLNERITLVPLLAAHGADVTWPFGPWEKVVVTMLGRAPSPEMMDVLQREGASVMASAVVEMK